MPETFTDKTRPLSVVAHDLCILIQGFMSSNEEGFTNKSLSEDGTFCWGMVRIKYVPQCIFHHI